MMNALKYYRSNRYCSVPQCKSRCTKEISLFMFPKDEKLKKKWAHALKIGKKITKYMYVCSLHFLQNDLILPGIPSKQRRLKKQAIPSQNLPEGSIKPRQANTKLAEARTERLKKRSLQSTSINENFKIEPNVEMELQVSTQRISSTVEEETIKEFVKPSKDVPHLQDAATQADETKLNKENLSLHDLITNNKQLNAFTGIPTFKLLQDIVKAVEFVENSFSTRTKVPALHRVILTFIKLKLNLSFVCISAFFKLNENSCKNYFHKTLQSLKIVLQYAIRFPEKEEILKNLPACFSKYRSTRIVLDCTEIPIEKFKCLNCRLRSYSQYKGMHTVKILIGSTPSGMISFVSKAYGGRTSDKAILVQSKLLEKCIYGVDAIMVDKGFKIEADCAHYNLKLIRPPFLKDKAQLSACDAIETAGIASARVHIERCIQRMKLFKILKGPISQYLLPYIDDIMVVIAAIVNLTQPILSEDKFVLHD